MPVVSYLNAVEALLQQGNATEHSYRPALKTLFETVIANAVATNEPKQKTGNAPDFELRVHGVPVGYIEVKDITVDIGKAIADSERDTPTAKSNGEQLKRYRAALPNLLYTNGLDWYWFMNGELHTTIPIHVATWNRTTKTLTQVTDAPTVLTTLLQQFAAHHAMLVGTPNELAQRLAQIARWLAEAIATVLTDETTQNTHGTLHQQLDAFRQTLLPTIKPTEFADMYAQTIVYGLFTARVAVPDNTHFSRADAAMAIPKTNPFVRKLFYYIAGIDLDTRIEWLVDMCANVLAHTDMSEVLRDFGTATKQEDPVVHFYETFLAAYDPKTREMRGVYYTPEPVVSYIVRSVDMLLQTHFGKRMGLADNDTLILDPATGTATFLHTVVQHIYHTLDSMGMADNWNQYVPHHLLPRLFGFELLMAPYTVAHLKLSMLLQQLGYDFARNERLGIYLTNALSDAPIGQYALPFAQFIADEATAANAVKHSKPVMVVLGNPPYSGHSANKFTWIDHLLHGTLPDGTSTENYYQVDGKPLGERNPKWLQDDYVKFIRFGQWRIAQTGEGILAFISNNGYLNNPTFRGMRESLLREFDTIYIVNLHGNSNQKERAPDGTSDENVFDIRQGVTIGIFVKQGVSPEHATVYYADVWGKRQTKYAALRGHDVTNTTWQTVSPSRPWYLFQPQNSNVQAEYEQWMSVHEILPVHSVGIVTARDKLAVQWNTQDMMAVIRDFVALPTETARAKYELGDDARDWTVALAQQDIKHNGTNAQYVKPLLYRTFDSRYTYYTGQTCGFICRPRQKIMQHMLIGNNIGLITIRRSRSQSDWNYCFVSSIPIAGATALTSLDINYFFPLYLYPNGNDHPDLFDYHNGRRPNFSAAFIADVEQRLGLSFIPDGKGDLTDTIGPEDIFHYMYAVLHSPTYRTRYTEFLKIDFPRVPVTSDLSLFTTLVQHGAALVDLHLLRTTHTPHQVGGAGGAAILSNPKQQGVTQHKTTSIPIQYVVYDEPRQRVAIAPDMFFAGIDPATWAMQIGGYQPLHKWLKDRTGRTLSFDETLHYMQMVIALRETRRLMREINAAIPAFPLV